MSVVIGLQPVWRPYPCLQPDMIPVRQAGDLLTASFRFLVTSDTLAVRLYPSRYYNRIMVKVYDNQPCPVHIHSIAQAVRMKGIMV